MLFILVNESFMLRNVGLSANKKLPLHSLPTFKFMNRQEEKKMATLNFNLRYTLHNTHRNNIENYNVFYVTIFGQPIFMIYIVNCVK